MTFEGHFWCNSTVFSWGTERTIDIVLSVAEDVTRGTRGAERQMKLKGNEMTIFYSGGSFFGGKALGEKGQMSPGTPECVFHASLGKNDKIVSFCPSVYAPVTKRRNLKIENCCLTPSECHPKWTGKEARHSLHPFLKLFLRKGLSWVWMSLFWLGLYF